MEYLRSILGLVLIAAVVAATDPEIVTKREASDPEIVTKRAVDVIDESKETTKRHPDDLTLLLKDGEGSDVRLRLRRGNSPLMSVEDADGVQRVQLREADEDAFYEVLNDQGVVMVSSVEQAPGVFKRSLSGSFLHDDKAYVIEAPDAHYSAKRDVGTDQSKHNLIKRFDVSAEKVARAKRASQNLGVEVYIIIDYTVYNHHYTEAQRNKNAALNNIRQYFAHVMSGVDIRYTNLQERDFSIYIRVKGIHVIESSSESTFSMSSSMRNPGINDQNMISGEFSLNGLRDWDKGRGRNFISKSDHVMAFTKKDLYSVKNDKADSGTVGIAFTKVMCTRDSYSVIEESGVFASEGTAAHELGHSLGAADHDGTKSAAWCPADKKFIMAPANANTVTEYNFMNPYMFSSCSASQFRSYFGSLGASNCMSNTASNVAGWERPVGEKPGQIMGAVAQCQGVHGDTSFPCPFGQKLADICRGLSCTTNIDGSRCSSASLAARGTSCGDKKWCDTATCVSDRYAPSMDETCPYGDFPSGFGGKPCASLIQSEPFRCYEKGVYEMCCGSCKKMKQNKRGCEYGDYKKFCSSLSRSQCSVGWNNWHCSCNKCAGVAVSNCNDDQYVLWGDKKCNAFVTSATKGKCYRDQVSQMCCASCSRVVNKADPGCLFGDNDRYNFNMGSGLFSCADLRRDPSLKQEACTGHSGVAQRCCETCRGL